MALTTCYAALVLAVLSATSQARADESPTCPPTPMRVTRSVGGTVDYLGTVQGIPALCRMNRPDGAGDFYFGVWRTDWPGAGQAYPAIWAVLNGATGTRASFVTRSYPGLQWTDTFVNEGHDTVVVAASAHDTVRVAHEREGIEGNTYHSIITAWRDARTGITLKVVENQISGQSYGPQTTWTATQVERLP